MNSVCTSKSYTHDLVRVWYLITCTLMKRLGPEEAPYALLVLKQSNAYTYITNARKEREGGRGHNGTRKKETKTKLHAPPPQHTHTRIPGILISHTFTSYIVYTRFYIFTSITC